LSNIAHHSLKLKEFKKFESATAALNEAAALGEGKVTPLLSSLLDSLKDEKKGSLAVADSKLASSIGKLTHLSLKPIADSSTFSSQQEVYRALRNHLSSLIPGLKPDDMDTTSLGLSHSLSRHKVKFSPDKVDTMIIQAISLLDDLDKELNTYSMRTSEWYGWHFPELAKIINDNLAYAKVVLKIGMRSNASKADLSEILPEEIETAVKVAAEVSMGTEITSEDLENIQMLAEQVVSFSEYRTQLSSYLSSRMQAIAPNLTALVGELVGARLIAHAGSLTNLMKQPASTIQILGAEKALFRALKTKHDTPKYGLIYHASLVGQATGRNKGKIARVLAAKAALGLRVDGMADQMEVEENERTEEERAALGIQARLYVERKLSKLEGKPLKAIGIQHAPSGQLTAGTTQPGKWEIKETRKYNADADGMSGNEPTAKKLIQEVEVNGQAVAGAEAEDSDVDMSDDEEDQTATIGKSETTVNGSASVEGNTKDQEKVDKAARKAAKEERRRQKAEKKARKAEKATKMSGKEAKKKVKDSTTPVDGKKRKHEGTEKKKKKQKIDD
jgi:nucleolar protein 58